MLILYYIIDRKRVLTISLTHSLTHFYSVSLSLLVTHSRVACRISTSSVDVMWCMSKVISFQMECGLGCEHACSVGTTPCGWCLH
jgi:hypothetical protein